MEQSPKILLIDDDADFLDGLKRTLRLYNRHWIILTAQNVDDAIDTVHTDIPDTIICDVRMPVKDGFDFLNWMQGNAQSKTIPVIMLTGAHENELKLKSLDSGATDLLNKPVMHGDLIARISNCLRLKKYHDEIIHQRNTLEEKVVERTRQVVLNAEISAILVQQQNFQTQLQKCTDAIVHHLNVAVANIWILNDNTGRLELKAAAGIRPHEDDHAVPFGQFQIEKIAEEKNPYLTNAAIGDPLVPEQDWAREEGIVSFAGYPFVANGKVVGVVSIFAKTPLNDSIFKAFASVSDDIALFIHTKKSEDALHKVTFYDSLTDLPNRTFFLDFMQKAVHGANRHREKVALLLIDIDNFSRINESLGHEAGDECLVTFSRRLIDVFKEENGPPVHRTESPLIVRMGEDHFVVLLHDVVNAGTISQIARQILFEFAKGVKIEGHEIFMSASIGIAVSPDDGNDVRVLLKNAEAALAHVKRNERNSHAFYSNFMNETSMALLDLDAQMRRALKQQEFRVFYQPKMDTATHHICGMEALIRWQQPAGKLVVPGAFIPLAEETGLIVPIGTWVLEAACAQNKTWQNAGKMKIPVAVNVSARQFMQKNFVETVFSILQKTGLDAAFLELEITETLIMANPDRAIQCLTELKNKGIKIALDDFGTGYSSLAYLQKLPIDKVKIDLSFVRNILVNPNDAAIVKTIIDMAHNLNKTVIAEGVETRQQQEFLRQMACDIIQGYLLSRPIPSYEFQQFVEKWQVAPPV